MGDPIPIITVAITSGSHIPCNGVGVGAGKQPRGSGEVPARAAGGRGPHRRGRRSLGLGTWQYRDLAAGGPAQETEGNALPLAR